MQMTEAEFFGQSIILWRDRLDGFIELQGGGSKSEEGMSLDRLAELEAEYPD